MFIVWGRKIVRKSLGYVLDFCPICRERRAFRLHRVGSAGHVYYISLGEGDLVGYSRTCTECKLLYSASIETYVRAVKSYTDLRDLERQTYPDFEAKRQGRLEMERRLRVEPRSFTPEERAELLLEPFELLGPRFEDHTSQLRFDLPATATLIGVILALFACFPIAERFGIGDLGRLLIPVAVVGLGVVIWQVLAGKGRYVRREILPLLARALRPLQPTDAELLGTIALQKKQRAKLASSVKLDELKQALQTAPLTPGFMVR